MKILRTASLGSNFTGSYKRKECIIIEKNQRGFTEKIQLYDNITFDMF